MANVKIKELVDKGTFRAYIPAFYQLKLMKVSAPEEYDNEYGEGHYSLLAGDPKLEGTQKEHWSPQWEKVLKKYQLPNGASIDPETLPEGEWVEIQTPPERSARETSITWAADASVVADHPFTVGNLLIDPKVDMICMGGDTTAPNPDWGCWPVKRDIFQNTYEDL